MSRISLGGGRSVSIRDYATGLARTGTPEGALRYARGQEETRKRDEKQREQRNTERERLAVEAAKRRHEQASSRLDNVSTPE